MFLTPTPPLQSFGHSWAPQSLGRSGVGNTPSPQERGGLDPSFWGFLGSRDAEEGWGLELPKPPGSWWGWCFSGQGDHGAGCSGESSELSVGKLEGSMCGAGCRTGYWGAAGGVCGAGCRELWAPAVGEFWLRSCPLHTHPGEMQGKRHGPILPRNSSCTDGQFLPPCTPEC